MNCAFGLFICSALLHVATSNTINLPDQEFSKPPEAEEVDFYSAQPKIPSANEYEFGDATINTEDKPRIISWTDYEANNLIEASQPTTNADSEVEFGLSNPADENNVINNNEVPQQIRQYTKDQLRYQFDILKACTQSPAAFSTQFISHMQHVFQLFTNELRSAFVNEVQQAFQDAMSDPGKVMTPEVMDEFKIILDTVKNWDISRRNLVRIFSSVAAYSKDEINQDDLQQAIMEVIKDEIVEDEQAFQKGDIGSFIKNAVIVEESQNDAQPAE